MNSDLMSAPSLELSLEIGERGKALQDPVARHGAPPFALGSHRHANTLGRMAADRRIDNAVRRGHPAVGDGQISACDRPGGQLSG